MTEPSWILRAEDSKAWAQHITESSVPDGDCVVWVGKIDRYGYGVFRVGGGRVTGAHRAAWLATRGPLGPGLVIDHRCRNRACVLVDHMEAVTNQVNTQRGEAGRHRRNPRTHCRNGHEYTEANTRWRTRRRDGYLYRDCRSCVAASKGRSAARVA